MRIRPVWLQNWNQICSHAVVLHLANCNLMEPNTLHFLKVITEAHILHGYIVPSIEEYTVPIEVHGN